MMPGTMVYVRGDGPIVLWSDPPHTKGSIIGHVLPDEVGLLLRGTSTIMGEALILFGDRFGWISHKVIVEVRS